MAFPQRVGRKIMDRITAFEPVTLILVAVAAGGLFIFLQLTGEVIEGDTHAFDEKLLLLLRTTDDPGMPVGPYWLSHAVNDITALGGVTVLTLMTVMVTVYLILSKRPAIAIFTFLSVVGGWLLSSLLKLGIARPRPEIVPHLVEVHDLSFPSGHAMLSAVTYLTLGALLSRAQPSRITRLYLIGVAVFLTFIIGLSRVYLGVHYPTDVLGGWCAGATWALICWLIARRYIARTPG
ncbi:phosphatase PAP2 family protein [Neorhizobium sp. T786]|uniref:phosphatase PAP2 family protein n=1 Tax=Pseudorhizobium xiangyangii TaxID=2883104 RepID=UPI001CFF6DAE|nr:phosphatase PAP2 family protein [Neorhizobium xiangyangii]MCB5204955.1 phosphatase PAP2 family protein [Neorhizobium xiangyangii]